MIRLGVVMITACFFMCGSFEGFGQKKTSAVTIRVTQTAEYCGGAAPTDEMLAQLRTPMAFPGQKIYLRKGKENCLSKKAVELTADSTGFIFTHLEPGFYSVVGKDKSGKSYYNDLLKRFSKESESYGKIDRECLKKWMQTPMMVIEVAEGKNDFSVNFENRCPWNSVPCVVYRGPFPP